MRVLLRIIVIYCAFMIIDYIMIVLIYLACEALCDYVYDKCYINKLYLLTYLHVLY